MSDFTQTAVIGAGVIGASWTALFLAAGKDVCVFDPSETARADVEDYVARAGFVAHCLIVSMLSRFWRRRRRLHLRFCNSVVSGALFSIR